MSNLYFDLVPVIPLAGRTRRPGGKMYKRTEAPRIKRQRGTLSTLDLRELGQHDLLIPSWGDAADLVNTAPGRQPIRVESLTRTAFKPWRKIIVDAFNFLTDIKHH